MSPSRTPRYSANNIVELRPNFASNETVCSRYAHWMRARATCDVAWIVFPTGAICLDLATRHQKWRLDLPLPDRLALPFARKIDTHWQRKVSYDAAADLLFQLTNGPDDGFTAYAIRGETGEITWSNSIPIPPPTEWTEEKPVTEMEHTEEMYAQIVSCGCEVVVLLRRNSRRSEVWLGNGTHFPLPPWRCQMHLYRFDSQTGQLLGESVHPGAWASRYEPVDFNGIFDRGFDLGEINLSTAHERTLITIPGRAETACCVNGKVYAAWKRKTEIGIVCFPRSKPHETSEFFIRRKGVRHLALHECGGEMLLQINESRLLPLNPFPPTRAELEFRPYLYHLHPLRDAWLVGCDGRGMALYTYRRDNSHKVFEEAGSGSVHGLFSIDSGQAVATRNKGLIDLFDDAGSRIRQFRDPSESTFLAASGRTLIGVAPQAAGGTPVLVDIPDP